MGITTIGISEAKAKLSIILKRAQRGETFFITQRGEKLAEIKPPVEVLLRKRRDAFNRMRAKRGKGMSSEEIVATIREGRENSAAGRYLRKTFGADVFKTPSE